MAKILKQIPVSLNLVRAMQSDSDDNEAWRLQITDDDHNIIGQVYFSDKLFARLMVNQFTPIENGAVMKVFVDE